MVWNLYKVPYYKWPIPKQSVNAFGFKQEFALFNLVKHKQNKFTFPTKEIIILYTNKRI